MRAFSDGVNVMKSAIAALLIALLTGIACAQTVNYYGYNGQRVGSANVSQNGNMAYYDASGRLMGSSTRASDGSVTYYGANKNFLGMAPPDPLHRTNYVRPNQNYAGYLMNSPTGMMIYYGPNNVRQGSLQAESQSLYYGRTGQRVGSAAAAVARRQAGVIQPVPTPDYFAAKLFGQAGRGY